MRVSLFGVMVLAFVFLAPVVLGQSVSHSPGEVTPGTFSGDYAFDGLLTVGDVSAGLFYDGVAGKLVVTSPDGSGALEVFDDRVAFSDKLIASSSGIEFSDGTIQTSAATGLWEESGSDIYYNNGNVGIGTVSPGSELEVTGDTIIQPGTGSLARLFVYGLGTRGESDTEYITINSQSETQNNFVIQTRFQRDR